MKSEIALLQMNSSRSAHRATHHGARGRRPAL